MNEHLIDLGKNPNFKSWILLWAFAESAIGGVMHALKIPFTGIIVGGIAVLCIAMIGHYFEHQPQRIIQALGVVLLVKLTLSPYSPWQAYVAVFFQGYLGYFLYKWNRNFKWTTLIFSTLCLVESAFQKVILSILIFGNSLISAIDQSAQQVLFTLGLSYENSFMYTVFAIYVMLYLIVGIFLGLWIPRIPAQMESIKSQLASLNVSGKVKVSKRKKHMSKIIGFLSVLVFSLIFIKWALPDFPLLNLFLFFLRSIAVSLIIVFLLGPLVMKWIKKWTSNQTIDSELFTETLGQIPVFSRKAFSLFEVVNDEYSGIKKIKYFIIGLIFLSQNETQDV